MRKNKSAPKEIEGSILVYREKSDKPKYRAVINPGEREFNRDEESFFGTFTVSRDTGEDGDLEPCLDLYLRLDPGPKPWSEIAPQGANINERGETIAVITYCNLVVHQMTYKLLDLLGSKWGARWAMVGVEALSVDRDVSGPYRPIGDTEELEVVQS